MHKIRWDDLNYVMALAECGSLSAAARMLDVNHATVLRRVQSFEAEQGVVLFDRPPGGYRLRPEGREILLALQSIDQTVGRVQRALRSMNSDVEGEIRLTTTDSIANILLPRHISSLRSTYPGIRIELLVANTVMDMARPDAEVSLRPTNGLPQGLTGRHIADTAFSVFGTPAYLAANPSHDPSDHVWLGVSQSLLRSPVGQWQDEHLPGPAFLRADSFLTLAQAALQGDGLVILPDFVGHYHDGLAKAEISIGAQSIGFWALTHPDFADQPLVRTVIDYFADAMVGDFDNL